LSGYIFKNKQVASLEL